jgi:hypothetical protein
LATFAQANQQQQSQRAHHHPQRRRNVSDDVLLQRLEPRPETSVLKDRAIHSRIRRPRVQPDAEQASHIRVGVLDGDAGFEARDTLVAEIGQELCAAFEPLRKNQLGLALKADASGMTPITVRGRESSVNVRPTMTDRPRSAAASSRR